MFCALGCLAAEGKRKSQAFLSILYLLGAIFNNVLEMLIYAVLSGNTTCLQGILCVLGSAQIPLIVINILWISLKTLNHAKNVLCLDNICYNPIDIE